jgi:hypothetical protein
MPIFCNRCNKDFNFRDLPTNKPIFCPDCGSPATIIDASELLQRGKSSKIDATTTLKSPMTSKIGYADPSKTQGPKPHSRPKYDRRIALVLSSLGIIGIVGIGHLYTKTTKGIRKGICFLIGGFVVYLFTIIPLYFYFFQPSAEYPDPEGGGKAAAIFFLIVFILIWLWQFLDLKKMINYPAQ